MTKDKHECGLKNLIPYYQRISPHASLRTKLTVWLKYHWTLNPHLASTKNNYRNKSTMLAEQKRHITGLFFFIIHPFSTVNEVRKLLFFLIWMYNIVVMPSVVAFKDFRFLGADASPARTILWDYISWCLQIVLIISVFFTGYIEKDTKTVVLEPLKICKRYLTGYFIFDVLSITIIGHFHYYKINMCCYARLLYLRNYCMESFRHLNMNEKFYECIVLAVETFLFVNFLTCFFYFVATVEYRGLKYWPPESFFVKASIDPNSEVAVATTYFTSTLLITCHFFGAGTGWFQIENVPSEKLILSLVMFVGRLWTLFVMAKLLSLFSILNVSDNKYEQYLVQLKVYMKQKRLPLELRDRIVEYYVYKYQQHFFDETKILPFLSNYIRQELLLWQARKLIQNARLFKAFPKTMVGSIIGSCKTMIYLAGDAVIKSGEKMEKIHFIASGAVAVTTRDGLEVAHLQDGDQFGLTSAISPEEAFYSLNYTAIETTEIYYITTEDFKTHVGNEDDILKFFAFVVKERLNKFQQTIRGSTVGRDFLSELSSGKILEVPRHRHRV